MRNAKQRNKQTNNKTPTASACRGDKKGPKATRKFEKKEKSSLSDVPKVK